ncbi:MAG TPA: hypothetical protein VGR93_11180 [Candidatus Acidoferrales bacterium]|nr:hypothetical protein [Candidatus Acidoferrales bacterium]
MNSKLKLIVITAGFFVIVAARSRSAYGAPQVGGCSMLTPAQIQKVIGQSFGAPTETKAPPAFAKQSWGSNCRYVSQTGSHSTLTFIVYVDGSAAEAKQTFDKLAPWYTPKSKPAIGDSAYIDKGGAIHVLKGKVRYFIFLDRGNEKQVKDLAASVAARI